MPIPTLRLRAPRASWRPSTRCRFRVTRRSAPRTSGGSCASTGAVGTGSLIALGSTSTVTPDGRAAEREVLVGTHRRERDERDERDEDFDDAEENSFLDMRSGDSDSPLERLQDSYMRSALIEGGATGAGFSGGP